MVYDRVPVSVTLTLTTDGSSQTDGQTNGYDVPETDVT